MSIERLRAWLDSMNRNFLSHPSVKHIFILPLYWWVASQALRLAGEAAGRISNDR
jgi:hypothetical protein